MCIRDSSNINTDESVSFHSISSSFLCSGFVGFKENENRRLNGIQTPESLADAHFENSFSNLFWLSIDSYRCTVRILRIADEEITRL